MFFWATAVTPDLLKWASSLEGCLRSCDTPRLLAQNITESVRVEKRLEQDRIWPARFQLVQSKLERDVADYSREPPRQVGRLFVGHQPSHDRSGSAQLHGGDALEIPVQLIERAEYREQLRGGLFPDAGHTGNVV